MKKQSALLGLLFIAPSIYGLVNLGDAGRIDFSLSGTLAYDSEIRARANNQSDTILSIRPSFVYTRPSKNMTIGASVGAIIQRYFDYNEYDDENFFFDLNISPNTEIEKSRFTFSGGLLLNSETRSDDQIGDIITTYNYGISGELTYHPNRKFAVISNASWRRDDPKSNVYNQLDRFSGGLLLQVPMRKEVFWNIGADLEKVQSDRNTRSDSDIWTYSTGISGTIMPKLAGSLSAGIQERKFDSGASNASPYFSANIGWTIDESTEVTVGSSISVGTTINDFATETTSFSVNLSRKLNRRTSASIGASYSLSDFKVFNSSAREDEAVAVNASLNYDLNAWSSLGAFGRYSDQTSDNSIFEYDRYRVGMRFSATW